MSKWEKLLARICALSKDLRFDELRKILESYGYERTQKWKQSLYIPKTRLSADHHTKA